MRGIRPQVWIGLLVNIFMVLLMFLGITYGDFSTQPEPTRQLMEELARSNSFYATYTVLLVLEALALPLVAMRHPAGLLLAVISSVFLLPVSLMYLLGCYSSYFTNGYAALSPAPKNETGYGRTFKTAPRPMLWAFCGLGGMLTLFFFSSGGVNPAFVLLLSFTLVCCYFVRRVNLAPPLALYDTYFVIRPHILAQTVAISYEQVRSATLLADDSILLKVQTAKGTLPVLWRLNYVDPQERRDALEEFGKRLMAHGVSLY